MVHIGDRYLDHLEGKIKELKINSGNKNIVDLYRVINELKEVYQSWNNLEKFRRAICMLFPTLFWISGEVTCFNYWMYFGLMILASV